MSNRIKIYGDVVKGCIFFDGSTVEPKFLGTILAEVKADETDRIVIYRTDRQDSLGNNRQLFKRMQDTRIQNEGGEDLVGTLSYTTQQVVDYINEQANLSATVNPVIDTSLNGVEVGFTLDATSTSIIFDNGYQYGVNTIKAMDTGDGLITIKSIEDARVLFTELDHTMVDINGSDAVGGLNDVINVLNELFTVGAFENIVISDPYSTMIADVDGEDTSVQYVGYGLDPVGNDIYGSTVSNSQNGLLTTETIDQAGEYFTFDIRVEGTIGFGLVHTQDSYDNGYYYGNSTYANPTTFGVSNSGHSGYQFSHWFHPTPNGSWTNYGANTGYSMRGGWSNFNGTDEQADWLAGNPIKVRVGIDNNSYISIETLRDGVNWMPHARTSYPIQQGAEFKLGIKTNHTGARVFSLPKVHLLEPVAPTMYFRYIESPDGVFHYPLFTTAEEAEYYDEIHNGLTAGTGSSHTHTYVDDPTNTTWYMPEASHDPTSYQYSSAPSNETFNGQPANYTAITSLTDADLTPTQFVGSDITQEEGTAVNLQVTPQGASWSTSVAITPSGSGLVYDGYSLVQGTLADVGSDTTYTVTVTRANSYGSSVGSLTITATDVAPVQSNDTAWTKALDFSGSNEHLKMTGSSNSINAVRMGGNSQSASNNSNSNKTSASSNARPFATAIVFKIDGNNSNQHIWNSGEGANSSNDNIYLRLDSSKNLYFGWGKASNSNECKFTTNLNSAHWYGIYIAFKGGRFNSSGASAQNLSNAFDIRLMTSEYGFPSVTSNLSTVDNWNDGTVGKSMLQTVSGDFTIGGRGSNRNFHGKVASMVCTSLMKNVDVPTDAEIKLMITDPIKWVTDYKVGQTYRYAVNNGTSTFALGQVNSYNATQVWLMGDGSSDSYANGIRNYIYTSDQNNTKLQLNSMVSNDIQNVTINGLSN